MSERYEFLQILSWYIQHSLPLIKMQGYYSSDK